MTKSSARAAEATGDEERSESKASWADFGTQVASGLIVGVAGGAIAGLVLVWATPWAVEQVQDPTCNDTEDLVLVSPSSVGATTWYHEPDERDDPPGGPGTPGSVKHEPHRAVDLDSGTAWVERSLTDEYGRGEAIRFQFADEVDLELICVINGYSKTWDLYQLNSRARQWAVTTDEGQVIAVLADKTEATYAAFQVLRFAPGPTDFVTLEIRSTRSGLGNEGDKDTALSEIEFWAKRGESSRPDSDPAMPTTTPLPEPGE